MDFDINKCLDYKVEKGPLTVENIKILGGANYFSGGPVVLIRLNLGEYDDVPTNEISGFFDELSSRLPSLYHHHCSEGVAGGFFMRVKEGTLLGHVVEHTAIELQNIAGMQLNFGKTRATLTKGVYNVIFRFIDAEAGIYAGKVAVNFINSILQKKTFDIQDAIFNLILIREFRLLGPSTQAVVDEAESRGIPCLRLDSYNLVQLGTGKYHKKIRATITSDTNFIAVETADNKYLTWLTLKDAGIPVPETQRVDSVNETIGFFHKINKPITIKPVEGSLGKNTCFNLRNEAEIMKSFELISETDNDFIVQPHIEGKIFRLLVINYKFVAAVELIPPFITGDGISSISSLIDKLNSQPERQIGDKGKLSKVLMDKQTLKIIADKGFSPESIIPPGEKIYLKISGNLKLGGKAIDVTDSVHPTNRFLAERACLSLGLNIGGVDVLAPEINHSIIDNGGVVLEVNAAPDFRMHLKPTEGLARNVAKPLVDMLFPDENKTRIPIISITGTLGKTITVNLINHILSQEGLMTGHTDTEGLYITGTCLMQGNMTYPEHVNLVLKDPTIDVAILETSREGILRYGLGYSFADIGIVLNMYDDHVGADDIRYLKDLAYAKSVVAEEVYKEGYSILNADNDLVYEMGSRLYSKLVLFSSNEKNKNILGHIASGGIAIVYSNGNITIHDAKKPPFSFAVQNIPITYGGKALLMMDNLLATVAACYCYGIPPERINQHLLSFVPDLDNLRGRMLMMDVNDFKVFVDYAHNKDSLLKLNDFLKSFPLKKIGIIDAAGDRSDEEIRQLGFIASQMFDEIIFYEGIDMRGRNNLEITGLLSEGAEKNNLAEGKITIIENAESAWLNGLKRGNAETMIVILTARAKDTMRIIETFKKDT